MLKRKVIMFPATKVLRPPSLSASHPEGIWAKAYVTKKAETRKPASEYEIFISLINTGKTIEIFLLFKYSPIYESQTRNNVKYACLLSKAFKPIQNLDKLGIIKLSIPAGS
jgi:hypothetical protein